MHAVRRTLSTAGLVGILVLAPGGAAFAATPTPTPDPSATAAASPDPTPAPVPSETTAPSPSESPTAEPTVEPTVEPTTDCDPFAASPRPDGVACIASGGGGAPAAPVGGEVVHDRNSNQLPRTGPAPLLPTVTAGLWLVLLGFVLALAGRRRTA